VGLVDDFHHLIHGLMDVGDEMNSALGEFGDAAHDLRDVVVSVKQGKGVQRVLEHHIDRIFAGKDSLVGGDGSDVMVGDHWSYFAPRVTVTPGGECFGDGEWGHESRGQHWGRYDTWDPHPYNHDGRGDEWIVGNDALNGGEGNDLLFGDSVSLLAPMMAISPGISWWDSLVVRSAVKGILEDVVAVGQDKPFAESRFYPNHMHNDFGDGSQGVSGGNDTLRDGNGDDILFGQGGDDVLFGDAGNDWLIGGEGNDLLEKGSGRDKIRYGNDSSRDLWRNVQTYLVDLTGKWDDFVGIGSGSFQYVKMTPSGQWVKDFVIDLAGSKGTRNPNGEIRIMLS
jgi:Ca2+-binding RTX toxin-like protein